MGNPIENGELQEISGLIQGSLPLSTRIHTYLTLKLITSEILASSERAKFLLDLKLREEAASNNPIRHELDTFFSYLEEAIFDKNINPIALVGWLNKLVR